MPSRQLSDTEIEEVIKFHLNTQYVPKIAPAFDKQQTIQILNAVLDGKTSTADNVWVIKYYNKKTEFFVKPLSGGYTPCGRFKVNDVVARLSL